MIIIVRVDLITYWGDISTIEALREAADALDAGGR